MFNSAAIDFALNMRMLACSIIFMSPLVSSAVEMNGEEIMAESQLRHQQFPYVYEEQSMILIDAAGNHRVRRSRLYTRLESNGGVKFLLIFDQPAEIRGVALLAKRDNEGKIQRSVYLPAFGPELKKPRGSGLEEQFLGTDFTIADLTPESLDDHRYVRLDDKRIDGKLFFVIEAHPRSKPNRHGRSSGLRRHLIRQDNFMIVRTDIYDAALRFYKRVSYHDLKQVDGDSWRANTIIAYDSREAHRTVLKVNRRVYSQDYVPEAIFEESYLLANRHINHAALGAPLTKASAAEQKLLSRSGD